MRLSFLLVFVLVNALAESAFADDSTQPGLDNQSVIIVLGDSLSAAYGMEISESWPSLLQKRLNQNGHAYRVFNSSITGDTTLGGYSRLPRLLEKHPPAIVLLELGGNDGLRGLPIEETRKNLSSMIVQSQAVGATVILAEMRIPPNYGRTYTEKFNQTYTYLEAEYGVTLLPFLLADVALKPELMQADGIHPAAAAQGLILDKVWQVLAPLLTLRHNATPH
jgi:acyl-CoA thioesterase-1